MRELDSGKVSRAAVKIDCRERGVAEREPLRDKPGKHAGEHVARARLRERGISRRIDENLPARRYDRSMPL